MPYANELDNVIGVTNSMPFWSNDSLRGVFSVDLTLGQVSVGLAAAKLGDVGRSWVIETPTAHMIGTSTTVPVSSKGRATDDDPGPARRQYFPKEKQSGKHEGGK